MRILVAEDDADIRQLVELVLGTHELTIAGDGAQALAILDRIDAPEFDVAVLDVMMPKVDGLTLVRHIRSARATEDLPVVLLTAKGAMEDRSDGFQAGADAYILKPFRPGQLEAAIEAVTSLDAEQRRRARAIAGELPGGG